MADALAAELALWQESVWVVSVAALTNAACALLGCYLVLRRLSLLGDALSHAVLPGLVIAFAMSGTFNISVMFIGAFIAGLATTFMTDVLHRQCSVPADAAMGVVFTSLFAFGVVLLKWFGQNAHIDADCVLFGRLDVVEFQTIAVAGFDLPRTLVTIAPVFFVNLLFVVICWKELLVTSFDSVLADTLGIRTSWFHYALMALVASTSVASFEAVGSILVVAMFIAPAAAAHLLCDRLANMIATAVGIAVFSAVAGYRLAVLTDTSAAGMMSVVVGLCFLAAVLLSPRYGVCVKLWLNLSTAKRITCEDLLAMFYRLEELAVDRLLGPGEAVQAVGGGLLARWGFWSLLQARLIQHSGDGVCLTERGRQRAASLVRSHRLWETYLVTVLDLPLDHVHDPAERMEHFISPDLQQRIEADLDVVEDPHGRSIPPKTSPTDAADS
jgi:manganese/zinc/iron transport system permease protein